ncbi:MAG: hypothetical protein IT285_13325 [Bdellovibrionales bacterium]|nr:hypothetical protein [Bdellovibrionales bacterium]
MGLVWENEFRAFGPAFIRDLMEADGVRVLWWNIESHHHNERLRGS